MPGTVKPNINSSLSFRERSDGHLIIDAKRCDCYDTDDLINQFQQIYNNSDGLYANGHAKVSNMNYTNNNHHVQSICALKTKIIKSPEKHKARSNKNNALTKGSQVSQDSILQQQQLKNRVKNKKQKKSFYDLLNINQKKKLDLIFKADPSLLEYYNSDKINYPGSRQFDSFDTQQFDKRVHELRKDKVFQEHKKAIINKYAFNVYGKINKNKIDSLITILTRKLDKTVMIDLVIKESNNPITCMADSGSKISVCNEGMMDKYGDYVATRSISFKAVSVNGGDVKLQKYLDFTVIDKTNPRPIFRKFNAKFYLLPECPFDFIIGLDVLDKLGYRMIRDRDLLAFVHHSTGNPTLLYKEMFDCLYYEPGQDNDVLATMELIKNREKYMKFGEFVNKETEELFHKTLYEFADVFTKNGEIGMHPEPMDLKLRANWIGFHDTQYTISHNQLADFKEIIKQHEEMGVIEQVPGNTDHPFISTSFLVYEGHKEYNQDGTSKKGKPRLVVNYQWVNLWIQRDRYPLPLIDDILSGLNGYLRYFMLDITKSFYHMLLTENASTYTTFHSPCGLYRFVRCPNGIHNGPPNLQRRLELLFKGLVDLRSYIDDILGGGKGKTEEEAEKNLLVLFIEVMKRLRRVNIKMKIEKCFFNVKVLEYLGRLISAKGIEAAPKHKSSIINAKPPTSKDELEKFLGIVNVFCSQVPNLSSYVSYFSDIRRKNVTFVWTEEHQAIFEMIKQQIHKLPVLFHPDLSKNGGRFWLFTDSSNYCLGEALMQERSKQLVPISFHSRMLQGSERNWHIFEQELESICEGCRTYSKILLMKPFVVVTDHENLLDVLNWSDKLNNKNYNHRLHRQLFCLAEFDFVVLYRPGITILIPDYLSRCIAHEVINKRMDFDGFLSEFCTKEQLKEIGNMAEVRNDKEYFDKFNKEHFDAMLQKVKLKDVTTGENINNYEQFKNIYITNKSKELHEKSVLNVAVLKEKVIKPSLKISTQTTFNQKPEELKMVKLPDKKLLNKINSGKKLKNTSKLMEFIKSVPLLKEMHEMGTGKRVKLTDNQKMDIVKYKMKAINIGEAIEPILNKFNPELNPNKLRDIINSNAHKLGEEYRKSNKYILETHKLKERVGELQRNNSNNLVINQLHLLPDQYSLMFSNEILPICTTITCLYQKTDKVHLCVSTRKQKDDMEKRDQLNINKAIEDSIRSYSASQQSSQSNFSHEMEQNNNNNQITHYEDPLLDLETEDVCFYEIPDDPELKQLLSDKLVNVTNIIKAQRNDPILNPIYQYLITSNKSFLEMIPYHAKFDVLRGYFNMRKDGLLLRDELIYIPRTFAPTIIHLFHNDIYFNHQGRGRIKPVLLDRFYWYNMDRDIQQYHDYCPLCQIVKKSKEGKQYKYKATIKPIRADQYISTDLVGPIKTDIYGNNYYIVYKDLFTQFIVIDGLKSCKAEDIIRSFLDQWVYAYGPPDVLISDNGSGYIDITMALIMSIFKIETILTSPHNPKANGPNEVVHDYINKRLGIQHVVGEYYQLIQKKQTVSSEWSKLLKSIQFSYNIGCSKKNELSAYQLRFGKLPRFPIDRKLDIKLKTLSSELLIDDELKKILDGKNKNNLKRRKCIAYYRKMKKELELLRKTAIQNTDKYNKEKEKQINKEINEEIDLLKPGDHVMIWKSFNYGDLSRKYRNRWDKGYIIIKAINNGSSYKLKQMDTGKEFNYHRDYIRKYNKSILKYQDQLIHQNQEIQLKRYFDKYYLNGMEFKENNHTNHNVSL